MAYDVTTGAPGWTFEPPRRHGLWGLEADAQTVYVLREERDAHQVWLVALDPADGQVRWQKVIRNNSYYNYRSRPAVGLESVFVFSTLDHQETLVAFAAADGTEQWRFPLQSSYGDYSPVYDGGRVFVRDRAPRWRNWLTALNLWN